MNTVKQMIVEEIGHLNEEIADYTPDSSEYKMVTERIDKLMAKLVEMERLEVEHQEKVVQMNEDKKDRIIKNVLQGLGIGLPLLVTIWGTNKSIKFEQDGTITTFAGRNFFNNLFKKK